ncbi:MAG TPA: hypothetical protein PLR71_01900 [Deltaproteobacteria bacterium]|nr:hypothetical protein [Deltaproteobacteria bacterium]HQI80286.1 hypothetical protein [Deltaproteobacteria bacterium]
MTQAGPSAQNRGGILKALMRSTLTKDLLRINVSSMSPDSGRRTVKTLLGDDPEVFFGISGGLPVFINSMTGALTELATQLKDKYPPELLKSFMASLAHDIDREAARECGRAWADLASAMIKASPELRTILIRAILSEGPAIKAGAVNALSRFVNGITRDDPQAMSRFVAAVMEKVDHEELGRAGAALTNALLDQKWRLASWTWKLVRGRVKKRFGI